MKQDIEITKLHHSKLNARRSAGKSDVSLKASIASHGLQQNLVVVAGKEPGHFDVVAGGRRLAALLELQSEKKLPIDYKVPCLVVDAANASESSLAENIVRVAMHPADEYEAFAKLAKDGMKPVEIAKRFGATEKHVAQRLKLGLVAPAIMEAFRADKIDVETMQAFTLSDDHARQLSVYKQAGKHASAWQVRRMMTEKMINANNDAMAQYVTIEAYEKAGGKTTKDLFGENVFVADVKLMHKLADKQLEAAAEKLRKEGWGWVEVKHVMNYDALSGYKTFTAKTKEDKAAGGAVVGIECHGGKEKIVRGLLKKGQKAPGEKGEKKAAKPAAPDLSAALKTDLERARWAVSFRHLSALPEITFDLFAFQAVMDALGERPDYAFTMSDNDYGRQLGDAGEKAIKDVQAGLPLDWMKTKAENDKFVNFVALPMKQKLQLFAFAVAQTFEDRLDNEKQLTPYETTLGRSMAFVGAGWRPTRENYLGRVRTEQLQKLGAELFGSKWKPKATTKSALVTILHDAFADPSKAAAGDKMVLDRINAWLPDGMAYRTSGAGTVTTAAPGEKKKAILKAAASAAKKKAA